MKGKNKLLLATSFVFVVGSSALGSYALLANKQDSIHVNQQLEQNASSSILQEPGFMSGGGAQTTQQGVITLKNKKTPDLNVVTYENDFAGKAINVGENIATIVKQPNDNTKHIAMIDGNSSEIIWTRPINNSEVINSLAYLEAKNIVYVLTHKKSENKICLYRLNAVDGSIIKIEDNDSKNIIVPINSKEKYFLVNAGGTNDTLLLNTRALMSPNNRKVYTWEIIDNQAKDMKMRTLQYSTNSASKLEKDYYLFSLSSIIVDKVTYYIEFACWNDLKLPEIWICTDEGHVISWYHSPIQFTETPNDMWQTTCSGIAVQVVGENSEKNLHITVPFNKANGQAQLMYCKFNITSREFPESGTLDLQAGPDYDFDYIYLEYDQKTKKYGDYYGFMKWASPSGTNLGRSGYRLRTTDWKKGDRLDSMDSYRYRNNTNTNNSRLFIYNSIKNLVSDDTIAIPSSNKNLTFLGNNSSNFIQLNLTKNVNGTFAYNTALADANLFIPNQSNVLSNAFDNEKAKTAVTSEMIFDAFTVHGPNATTTIEVQNPATVSTEELYLGTTKADITIDKAWVLGTLQNSTTIKKNVNLIGFHQWVTEPTSQSIPVEKEFAGKSVDSVKHDNLLKYVYTHKDELIKDLPLGLQKTDFSINKVTKDELKGTVSFNVRLSSYINEEHKLETSSKDFEITLSGFSTKLPWWVWALIAGGIILLVIIIIVVIMSINKKNEEKKRKQLANNRRVQSLSSSRQAQARLPRPQGSNRPSQPPRRPIR